MPLEAEAIEQRLLHHPPLAHHPQNLLHPAEGNQQSAHRSSGVFQHLVMGGSSSSKATTIGLAIGRGVMTWIILLASISRWMRPTSVLSTAKAWWFAKARRRRQRNRSRTSSRKRRAVVGSYSRPDAWRRSCF